MADVSGAIKEALAQTGSSLFEINVRRGNDNVSSALHHHLIEVKCACVYFTCCCVCVYLSNASKTQRGSTAKNATDAANAIDYVHANAFDDDEVS